MCTRRTVLRQLAATGLVAGPLGAPLAAQDRYDQAALLDFAPLGQITLLHYGDLHGMLRPHYLRPAAVKHGPDRVPNLTGEALRIRYGVGGRTPMDAALTSEGFDALAEVYGPMGGLAHLATLVAAIRTARPGTVVIDGGSSDTPVVHEVLRPDVVPGDRADLAGGAGAAQTQGGWPVALAARGGAQIAIVDLASPGGPPGGIDLAALQRDITDLRQQGAGVIVALSQLGFEGDRALAGAVTGLDLILSGRDGAALPEPEGVADTRIIASGAQGRFVSRMDIQTDKGRMTDLHHKLIPVFSDLITPDAATLALLPPVDATVLGTSDVILHHLDSFGGTWEAVIADALREEFGAQVALVAPLRAAPGILPGQPITAQDVRLAAQSRWGRVQQMSGAQIKEHLENAAEAAFAKDPKARRTTRMMRAGGIRLTLRPAGAAGHRVSELALPGTGAPVADSDTLAVAVLGDGPKGTPLAEILTRYITRRGRVTATPLPVRIMD